MRDVLGAAHDLGKERVGDVGDDHAERLRLLPGEAAGEQVRLIAERGDRRPTRAFSAGLTNALSLRTADTVATETRARAGDVVDVRHETSRPKRTVPNSLVVNGRPDSNTRCQQSASAGENGLTSTFSAIIPCRWRSASLRPQRDARHDDMTKQKLLYRSARVAGPHRRRAGPDAARARVGPDPFRGAASGRRRGVVRAVARRGALHRPAAGRVRGDVGGATHRVGPRADVFLGYPHAVYLPARTPFRIVASVACEIADCRAPSTRALAPRVIRPEDCGYEIRGGGNATRQIVDIVPPGFPADRLLICEVYTPGGNWSSYPPHKHDTDDPPRETDLEEIYYFRYRDPNGYGFQRSTPIGATNAARDARRRRRRARRLSPVCYSLRVRCLLSERAGRDAAVDGGQRRSPIREIPPRLAAADPRLPLVPPRRARLMSA